MKILYLTPRTPYPPDDGGKIASFGLIKYLALRGHDITLLSIAPSYANNISELKRYCRVETGMKGTSNSYKDMLLNMLSKVPYTISKYHSKAFLDKLRKVVRGNHFDIVHIEQLHMAYYGEFIKKEFGLPIVLREQNVESTIWERYYLEASDPLIKFYARLQLHKVYTYESKIAAEFDRCFMITEKDKERILMMNPNVKASVIPGGVDISYFYPLDIPIEPYSVVSVASIEWPPNIDGILWFVNRVWPLVKLKLPQARFYVVGKNPPAKIKKLAKKDIIVTGYVEDVRKYIARATVFVVPLRTGGGMRIKILNAMAMGKAVLSTAVGCEGLDIENGKNIYVADSEKEFAHLILKLLQDECERKKIGEQALKLVIELYRWDKVAEQTEYEYKNILGTQK
mgnify:CR=1 FL=1